MGPRILLVDDEPDTLKVYSDLLRSEGYDVFTAADGEQALSMIDQCKPNAILLDVRLPGKSGVEVARELSRGIEKRDIPIVVLTALTVFPEQDEMARLPGVRRFIYKPCRPRTLLEALSEVFRYRR